LGITKWLRIEGIKNKILAKTVVELSDERGGRNNQDGIAQ
jgi:hypothetical protein